MVFRGTKRNFPKRGIATVESKLLLDDVAVKFLGKSGAGMISRKLLHEQSSLAIRISDRNPDLPASLSLGIAVASGFEISPCNDFQFSLWKLLAETVPLSLCPRALPCAFFCLFGRPYSLSCTVE